MKENPPPIKSELQIQWGTLNKPSNANDLNQVLKLAEKLRIKNYLKFLANCLETPLKKLIFEKLLTKSPQLYKKETRSQIFFREFAKF